MSLRIYQREDLGKVVEAFERGCTRQVGVQATGSGKTVLVSHLPEALDLAPWQKMLLLVHRDPLVWQSKEKLEKYNPDLVVDIEKAQYRADTNADIIVASVQTIGRNKVDENGNWVWCDRISKFDPDDFSVIVVDEGHHCLASTYSSVLRYFRCYKPEPQFDDRSKLLLLVTATPKRSDGIGLEVLADEITFRRDIRQQIQDGWLADIKAYRIDTEVDISKVAVERGEFDTKELEQKVNTKERNQLVVRKYQELGEGQRGVAFTVDVQHSVDLAQEFRNAGITAFALAGKRIPEEQKLIQELLAKHWIVAKTHDEECKAILKLLDEGVVKVVVSCDKLCLDDQTEILTVDGWKGIDELLPEDQVANWEDGSIFFEKPRAIYKRNRDYGESMISLESQDYNIRVTEDHRVLYRTFRTGKFKLKKAAELVGKRVQIPVSGIASPLAVEPSQPVARTTMRVSRHIASRSYHIRQSNPGMSSQESRALALEAITEEATSNFYKRPSDLSANECAFIGFWFGDGSKTPLTKGGVEYTICQSTTYPAIIAWVDKLLARLDMDYIRRFHPSNGKQNAWVTWHFPRGTGCGAQRRRGVFQIEPYLVKGRNDLLWGLNQEQFDAFILGLWYADGMHGKAEKPPKKTFRITGTKRKALDFIQAVAVCRGYAGRIKRQKVPNRPSHHAVCSILTLERKTAGAVGGWGQNLLEEKEWKSERVWCVTSTSGKILVRRNGIVHVTGNSEGWDSPSVVVAMMTRPWRAPLPFTQQVGRVLRLYPSPEDLAAMRARGEEPEWIKQYAIVLDFVDVAGKHAASLNTVPTLFGMRPDFNMKGKKVVETVETVEKILREKAKGVTPSMFTSLEELKGIAQRIDIFSKPVIPEEARQLSQMAWLKSATGGYELPLPDLTLRIDQNTLGQYEVYRFVNGFRSKVGTSAALPEAFKQAEVLVPLDQQILSQADAKWRFEPPTIDQATLLMRLAKKKAPQLIAGAKTPEEFLGILKSNYNKGDVSMLITQYDDRARDGGGKKPWENKQRWNGGGKPWSARNRKYAAKGRKP